jgi:hypothetical protein
VGATRYPAAHHHVSLGDLVLDRDLQIGKSGAVHADQSFEALGAAHHSLDTGGTVADEVRGKKLIYYIQVPFVPDLLEIAADDGLILLGRER